MLPPPSPANHPAPRARRAGLAAALLVGALSVTGCAGTSGPDPALVSMAGDALSATQTARLGIELDGDERIFATTFSVVLEDMASALADTERDLVLAPASTPADAEYRAQALDATRDALDAVRAAQHGDSDDALEGLSAAARQLDGLEGVG